MKSINEDISILTDGMDDETDEINAMMNELGVGPDEGDNEIHDHDWFVSQGIIDEA